MRRRFGRSNMPQAGRNPNLQDALNRLSIPPLAQVSDPAAQQSADEDPLLLGQGETQVDSVNQMTTMKFGPWGGQGGRTWEWDGTIQSIFVNHGTVVYSITFQSMEDGAIVWSETFGGGDGDDGELCEISIKEPEEYLIAIRGTTGIYRYTTPLITSLTFVSNVRSYGPFGEDTTDQFLVPVDKGKIAGFYGRCGGLLDAIGINLVPLDLPKPIPRMCSNSEMDNVMKIGPWGGQGGGAWEWDRPVHKIVLRHGLLVDSITFGSMRNGVTVWSKKFGGDGGEEHTKISIDEPAEYLVAIRTTTAIAVRVVGRNLPLPVVTSITFISNKRSYGPFGRVTADHFCIPKHGRMIVGFHGRAGRFLDSIGFSLGPLSPS